MYLERIVLPGFLSIKHAASSFVICSILMFALSCSFCHCVSQIHPSMATLFYDGSRAPPVSLLSIIAASSLNITLSPTLSPTDPTRLSFSTGEEFVGNSIIIRYLARAASADLNLYGVDNLTATQVDFFIELSRSLSSKDTLSSNATLLNNHLASRTTLAGNNITAGDLAVYEALLLNPRWKSFQKESANFVHLFRWQRFLSSSPLFSSTLGQLTQLAEAKKQEMYDQSFGGSFKLQGDAAMKKGQKVVTRFPPEPSGYLHVGHAKAALLNYYYAKEYDGELIVRFDDTNPSKEKDEYVESILADIAKLGIKYSKLTYISDYFDLLFDFCTRLINDGNAYVDDTPVEKMRAERMDGIPSTSRNRSVEENLSLWEEMKNGTEQGLKCVVRAKIDMSAKNKTLRDPTLYRCNVKVPHHRTGTKYKAYPTYDFCCPIVDSIEGCTHVLRTIEYRDRNEQYMWVLRALSLRMPVIRDYSRLNFVYTLMSKRKLQWFVDQKLVEGWHDARFPTVQGIIRRGMTIEAITEFMTLQGFSISVNYMEWDKIWSINKRIIDPVAHRYTAIAADNKVPFTLTNADKHITYHSIQLHPKDAAIGNKVIAHSSVIYLEQDDAKMIAKGEEVTLMSWGNAFVDNIETDSNGVVVSLSGRLHLEGDFKKTEKKLTWIGGSSADFVLVNLVEFDHLITVEKLEEDQKLEEDRSLVRSPSRFDTLAVGEQALRNVRQGQIIQLNRRGFFRVDEIGGTGRDGKPIQLFLIPDGKQKSMSTLGTKIDKSADKANAANNKKSAKQ